MAEDLVHVIAPDGTPGTLPASKLNGLTNDWKIESAQDRKERLYKQKAGLGTSLGAAAEGAASAATLGLYDVAAAHFGGDQYREERALREKAAPISSMVGTAAGIVTPALLSGGESLLARGAAGAGEVAAKAGAATALAESGAAGGAAARGLLGLGRVATAPARVALKLGRGAESLAGDALKAAGVGTESLAGRALTGGAKMAASGAVEGAAYGAGQALSETALAPGGDYSHLAEKVLAGAEHGALFGAALGGGIGTVGGVASKVTSKMAERIGDINLAREAGENAIRAVSAEKGIVKKLGVDSEALGKKLLDDDIVRGGRSYEEMLGRSKSVQRVADESGANAISVLDDAGLRPNTPGALARIQEDILTPLSRSEPAVAKAVAAQLEHLGADATFEQLHRFKNSLSAQSAWGSRLSPEALKKAVSGISGIVDETIAHGAADGFAKLTREDIKAIGLKRALATEADSVAAAQHADQFVASMADGGAMRAYQDAALSSRAAKFAEEQILKRAETTDTVERGLGLTSDIHGAASFAMAAAHGLGPGMALGAATSAASKYLARHGRSIVADLAYRASKADTALLGKVKAFVRGTGEARRAAIGEAAAVDVDHALNKGPRETRGEAFERMSASVRAGPTAAPMVVDAEAPGTGKAMRDVIQKGMAFLATKLPPGQDNPSPFYKPPPASAENVAKFARYVKAVKDPLSVLDSLNNGTVSGEEIEALQAVYPSLYEQVKQTMTDEVMSRKQKKPLPEHKAIQIGVLFQIPTIPMLELGNYQAIQASYAPVMQPPQQQPAPQGTAPSPAQSKVTKAFATESDRMESGEMQI